jgi:predicted DNA-binding transcriptional regulator AlpA
MTATATTTTTTLDLDDRRPFVSAEEAFAFLGIDRTTGYRAIHDRSFPVPVIKVGRLYRVPTVMLRRLVEGESAGGDEPDEYTHPPTSDSSADVRCPGSRPERVRSHTPAAARDARKG